jgi:hypothetical protein
MRGATGRPAPNKSISDEQLIKDIRWHSLTRMIEDESMDDARKNSSGIKSGAAVVLVLHSPREKCWGVLDEINSAGILLRGLDLNAFDDWVRAVAHDEPFIGFGDLFFPMWRVERLSRDERAGGIPSLTEQFEQRTGRSIRDFLEN